MSNVVKFRSAAEQCREYVEKQRTEERRRQADRAIDRHLAAMSAEFGQLMTLGALMRRVGRELVGGGNRYVVRRCCCYLAGSIGRAMLKSLTPRRILH